MLNWQCTCWPTSFGSSVADSALEPRQDKWECPSCAAGEALPPPRPRACTLREKYLGGAAGVELVRITGLWKDRAVGKAGFSFRGPVVRAAGEHALRASGKTSIPASPVRLCRRPLQPMCHCLHQP